MSKWVRIGSVRVCDGVKPDREQVLKVLEEAAEVFSAWEYAEACGSEYADPDTVQPTGDGECYERECLLDECADVVQAVSGLVHALGVEDFRVWMDRCEQRQRERGRITDGA